MKFTNFTNLICTLFLLAAFSLASGQSSAPAPITNAGAPTAGTSEVQTVVQTGFAAGILSLKFRGQTATVTFVGNEANSAISAALDTALEALSEIGTSGVSISTAGTTDRTSTITFGGNLALQALPLMTGSLTGAGTLTIAEGTPGVDATGKGSPTGQLLIDTTNAKTYQNTGTAVAPVWAMLNQNNGKTTITIPITSLATGLSTSAIDILTNYTPGYAFKLLKFDFVTTVAGTGSGASQVFNLEIGTTNVTGGVLTVTLSSTDTIGKVTAGTSITAANTGSATDTLSIEMAASGTVFTAGAGYFVIELQNID